MGSIVLLRHLTLVARPLVTSAKDVMFYVAFFCLSASVLATTDWI